MRMCSHCFPRSSERGTCIICLHEAGRSCPCNEHHICDECLECHVSDLLQNVLWDGKVHCPCGLGSSMRLPQKLRLAIAERDVVAPDLSFNYVDYAINNILNLRCPKCGMVFVDFDGCLALYCNCGQFFCALCLMAKDDSASCHLHVLKCTYALLYNSNGYYMRLEKWHCFQRDRKCLMLWAYLCRVLMETCSLRYTMCVARDIHKCDLSLFPTLLFKCRCSSLVTPAVMLSCIVILFI